MTAQMHDGTRVYSFIETALNALPEDVLASVTDSQNKPFVDQHTEVIVFFTQCGMKPYDDCMTPMIAASLVAKNRLCIVINYSEARELIDLLASFAEKSEIVVPENLHYDRSLSIHVTPNNLISLYQTLEKHKLLTLYKFLRILFSKTTLQIAIYYLCCADAASDAIVPSYVLGSAISEKFRTVIYLSDYCLSQTRKYFDVNQMETSITVDVLFQGRIKLTFNKKVVDTIKIPYFSSLLETGGIEFGVNLMSSTRLMNFNNVDNIVCIAYSVDTQFIQNKWWINPENGTISATQTETHTINCIPMIVYTKKNDNYVIFFSCHFSNITDALNPRSEMIIPTEEQVIFSQLYRLPSAFASAPLQSALTPDINTYPSVQPGVPCG